MKRTKKPDPAASQASPVLQLRPEELAAAQRRAFPGPKGAQAALRVALDKPAFDAVMDHAHESMGAEVCGVLVGNVCQDDAGVFTHITHAVRGQGAAEGSTHVTFTQATWNAIHEVMDKEHVGRAIVGWYHTHPGFGVEFSDMDVFIQRNFFNGPAQVALVTDPKTDVVALAMNAPEGIQYLPRFWLDGRERAATTPTPPYDETEAAATAAPGTQQPTAPQLRVLEERIAQLTQAMDEMRSWLHWLLLACGGVVCAGVIVFVSSLIREQFRARVSPPELVSHVPVPIKVGDKNVLLGVSISQWQVPPELNAIMLDLAREEAAEQKEKEKEQAAKGDQEKQADTAAKPEAKAEAETKAAPQTTPAAPPPTPPASAEKPEKTARP